MRLVESRHLSSLRKEEIESVKSWFKPGASVLEIGGGNGYQAHLVASWGCRVKSIDLPREKAEKEWYFPVQPYDGQHIPFPNETFDVLFSSNVLEHVDKLDVLLAETRRVLRPGGLCVHILPTPSWRLWTSMAHYLAVLRYCVGGLLDTKQDHDLSLHRTTQARGVWHVVKRALFAGPHGEYPNAVSELYYFSRFRWSRTFQKSGFQLVGTAVNDLFYTGYGLSPGMPIAGRRRLARVLGSSCNIFVLRTTDP